MNVIPKASALDVAGVMGLLAFLADKDACAARLAELQAMAAVAEQAERKAVAAQNEAANAQRAAVEAQEKAANVAHATEAAHAAVAAREARAEQHAAELRIEGDRLAAWQNDIDAKAAALAVREAKIIEREQAVEALHAQAAHTLAEVEQQREKLRKALA